MSWQEAFVCVAAIAGFVALTHLALPYVVGRSATSRQTEALADVNKRLNAVEAHFMSGPRLPNNIRRSG